MNQPKYVLLENNKAASESSEAAFILCTHKPKFMAEIKQFRTLSELDSYSTENLFVQVRDNLPIILQVVEVEEEHTLNQLLSALKYMAKWYYYAHLKN